MHTSMPDREGVWRNMCVTAALICTRRLMFEATCCAAAAPRSFATYGKQVLCARAAVQYMARPAEWRGAFIAAAGC
jgi:hypothetical protein